MLLRQAQEDVKDEVDTRALVLSSKVQQQAVLKRTKITLGGPVVSSCGEPSIITYYTFIYIYIYIYINNILYIYIPYYTFV